MGKNLKLLGIWLVTILAQFIAANLAVFIFSLLLYVENPTTLSRFLLNVSFIGLGFLIGVYGAGMLILRRRKLADLQARPRFFATLVCILVPLLALAVLGWRISPTNPAGFRAVVLEQWQPTLGQSALWLSILGFHLPGWLKRQPALVVDPV